jgi:hypothetical protein
MNAWNACSRHDGLCLHGLLTAHTRRLYCDTCYHDLLWQPLAFIDAFRQPVAIVCQTYHPDRTKFLQFADDLGLKASTPPAYYASIADPGESNFVVYTRSDICVKWLPEQL